MHSEPIEKKTDHILPGTPDFKAVFDSLPGIYLLLNPDLTMVAASNDRLRATNTTREQTLGRCIFDIFPDNPEAPDAKGVMNLRSSLERVLQTKKPHRMAVQRYDIPESETSNTFIERFWSPLNSPVLNAEGDLIYIIHHVEDVTELIQSQKHVQNVEVKELDTWTFAHNLKMAHEKLEQAQYELKQLIMLNPIPMVLWRGPEHTYSLVNNAHDKLIGKPVIGKTIRQAFAPEEAKGVPATLDQVYQSGVPYVSKEHHYCVIDEEGKSNDFWINEWFYPFRDNDKNVIGILGVAQDVTEQVAARLAVIEKQVELQKSVLELKQEREAREQFVATLSHDLRTPLTAAKLTSQLISRKADDEDTVRKLANKITDNIERTDAMIRDLLDANRIKAGESLPLEIFECDLTQITRDTIDELSTEFGDRFRMELPSEPVVGKWSAKDIQRVLENLCSNAVKYGAKEEKVLVKIVHSNSDIKLSVSNKGQAISTEDQKSLFDVYRRTESAHLGQAKGWGLGLTLVKGIVEAHKGTVKVESSPDTGTTFIINLPK